MEKRTEEIELYLDDETFLFAAKQAHELDITFNDYVNLILEQELKRENS